jgi:SH3-like domain-containing protein
LAAGLGTLPSMTAVASGPQVPGSTGVAATGALAVGGFALIANTDGFGARYRFGPGPDFATIRIVEDGETLQVVSGPELAGSFTWWRVQDALGNFGWVAQEYLVPTAGPALWSPPAASPTFATDALSSPAP